MPLNVATRRLLNQFEMSHQKPIHLMSIEEYRRITKDVNLLAGEAAPMASVIEWKVPRIHGSGEIVCRQYIPDELSSQGGMIYFRGSGFVDGRLEGEDVIYRLLAKKSGCTVFAVSYRSAPEYPYPHGMNDACWASQWIMERADMLNIDHKKMAIAGYSSGGNFAAIVTHHLRDEGILFAQQVLICPILDLTCSLPAHKRNAEGYVLTHQAVKWYLNHYLPAHVDPQHPAVSPLYQTDFHDFPNTLIVTAEYDPLCDDGKVYAEKLKLAGIPAAYSCYQGHIHQMWLYQGILKGVDQPLDEIVQVLQNRL
jgi:acetyl esterase